MQVAVLVIVKPCFSRCDTDSCIVRNHVLLPAFLLRFLRGFNHHVRWYWLGNNNSGIYSGSTDVADGVPGDCVSGTLPRVIQAVLEIVVNGRCCACVENC